MTVQYKSNSITSEPLEYIDDEAADSSTSKQHQSMRKTLSLYSCLRTIRPVSVHVSIWAPRPEPMSGVYTIDEEHLMVAGICRWRCCRVSLLNPFSLPDALRGIFHARGYGEAAIYGTSETGIRL